MSDKRLTKMQKAFIDEYLKNPEANATEAVRKAGYKTKYPDKIAYQLLENPRVKNELKKVQDKRQERTEITQDMVLKELALIAFSDPQDIIEIEEGGTILMKKFEDMPEGVSRTISDISEDRIIRESPDGSQAIVHDKVKYKRYDKVKALELLGKHLGMFADKLNIPTNFKFEITYANGNGTKPKPRRANN